MIGPRPKVFAKLGMTELGLFCLLVNLLNQAGCAMQLKYIAPLLTDFEQTKQGWAEYIESGLRVFQKAIPLLQGVAPERAAAMLALAELVNAIDLGAVEPVNLAEPLTESSFRKRINALVELLFDGPKQVMRTERSAE